MKAMVLHEFGQDLKLEDVEIPKISPNEALVKIAVCACDRLDTTIKSGRSQNIKLPIILGHEIAGEVVEVGAEVTNVNPGDRVVVYTFFTCGECKWCRTGRENICANFRGIIGMHFDGGYAEYVKATSRNLVKIPDGMSFEDASMATNCVVTSVHVLKSRAHLEPLDDVRVVGGGGGVGIHCVQVAKAFGARNVIAVDVFEDKLERAKSVGADYTILSNKGKSFEKEVMDITEGRGVDVVVELAGLTETIEAATRTLAFGGRMVIPAVNFGPGFTMDTAILRHKEAIVTGSKGACKFELVDSLELLRLGKVKPVVSAQFPLEEANHALKLDIENKVTGRAILTM